MDIERWLIGPMEYDIYAHNTILLLPSIIALNGQFPNKQKKKELCKIDTHLQKCLSPFNINVSNLILNNNNKIFVYHYPYTSYDLYKNFIISLFWGINNNWR